MFTYVGSDKRYSYMTIVICFKTKVYIQVVRLLSPHPCDIKLIILYNLLYHVFENAQVDDVIWNNVKYYSVAM